MGHQIILDFIKFDLITIQQQLYALVSKKFSVCNEGYRFTFYFTQDTIDRVNKLTREELVDKFNGPLSYFGDKLYVVRELGYNWQKKRSRRKPYSCNCTVTHGISSSMSFHAFIAAFVLQNTGNVNLVNIIKKRICFRYGAKGNCFI